MGWTALIDTETGQEVGVVGDAGWDVVGSFVDSLGGSIFDYEDTHTAAEYQIERMRRYNLLWARQDDWLPKLTKAYLDPQYGVGHAPTKDEIESTIEFVLP